MINKTLLSGRISRVPELNHTSSGVSVTSFSIGAGRPGRGPNGERRCDYFDVITWGKNAEYVCKRFKKGDLVIVDGQLQIRLWTDKAGNKKRSYEIVADNVYFAGGPKENEDDVYYPVVHHTPEKADTDSNMEAEPELAV